MKHFVSNFKSTNLIIVSQVNCKKKKIYSSTFLHRHPTKVLGEDIHKIKKEILYKVLCNKIGLKISSTAHNNGSWSQDYLGNGGREGGGSEGRGGGLELFPLEPPENR